MTGNFPLVNGCECRNVYPNTCTFVSEVKYDGRRLCIPCFRKWHRDVIDRQDWNDKK